MKKLLIYNGLTILLILSPSIGFSSRSDIETIRGHVVVELMKPAVSDVLVQDLLNTIHDDGTWPGINYKDVSRTAFEHRIHLANMVALARAYKNPDSKFHKSQKVKNAIKSALGFWVENDFICDNWWHNQIGTPNSLVTLMLLIGDELPKDLVDKAQPMIGRANLSASGARPSGDRIKIAGILAENLLFLNDEKHFDEVIKVIEGEIKFADGRGMQYDYSFHHRTDGVNNTLSYGLQYANVFAEWASYVAGTEYAFSESKLQQLIDYYLDGICKMMVYGKYPDPGAKNRGISRPGALKPMDSSIPEKLLKITSYRSNELEEIVKIRNDKASPSLAHSTFFWHSEYYSHQRPGYFVSARMFSTRNDNMEVPYNSEGLKNHHLGDGASFVSLTGREYYNIFPVFDWQKIPGATIMQKPELPPADEIQKQGLTDFVGGVTDGKYGAAVFDFKSPHDPLEAKKAWFFFDDEYVCLGAGINASGKLPVATTLNQCLLDGDVTVDDNNGPRTIQKGERQLNNIQWVHSNGIAYIFPEPRAVYLINDVATGSWYDINKQSDTPKEKVSKEVFKLWIDHGARPVNEKYSYIVVPGISSGKIKSYSENTKVEILNNTPEVQAVKHAGLHICQAVFYKSGTVQVSEKIKLVCDSPGMIMLQTNGEKPVKVTVSDPNRELGKIHFSISSRIEKKGDNFSILWNEKEEMSEVSIELPRGVYAGQSVIIEL